MKDDPCAVQLEKREGEPVQARQLSFQKACGCHEELLLEWKNDETAREQSFLPRVITAEEHHRWFRAVLARADITLLILYWGEAPTGSVRFERAGEQAEISYSIDSRYRGLGLGNRLIGMAVQYAQETLALSRLCARVKKDNVPSQRVLLANGFRNLGELDDRPGYLFGKQLEAHSQQIPEIAPPPQDIPFVEFGFIILALPVLPFLRRCSLTPGLHEGRGPR